MISLHHMQKRSRPTSMQTISSHTESRYDFLKNQTSMGKILSISINE